MGQVLVRPPGRCIGKNSILRMKSSFKVAFFVLVSCSVAVSELCRSAEVNSIKWRRHPDDCSTAYMCLLGQVVSYRCPEGYVIGTDEVTCVPAGSPLDDCSELERVYLEDVEIKPLKMSPGCKEGQTMSDERSCAKYSECVALPDGNTTTLIKECNYPFLFDVQTGKCEHFKDVKCQPGQIIPKSPCDYQVQKCTSAHCVPCNIRYPTCTGLPDGINPWVGREWTPYYVICEEERVTLQGQCKSEKEQKVFHPEQKTCVEYDVEKIVG